MIRILLENKYEFAMIPKESTTDITAEVRALVAALVEIQEGRGPFSHDQFEYACAVIDRSKELANEALAQCPAALKPGGDEG